MTSEEVVALVKKNGGELCGLVTRGPDGTVLTSDPRAKSSRILNPWQFKIGGLMALIACLAPVFGMFRVFKDSIGEVRTLGAIRVGPTNSYIPVNCSDDDADDEPAPQGCLDDCASADSTASPPGAQP